MAPVDGFQDIVEQILEPDLVKQLHGLVVGLALLVHELERTALHEPVYLPDGAGQVVVQLDVVVDVVEVRPVGIFNIHGPLAGLAPALDVVLHEAARLQVEVDHDLLQPPAVALFRKVEFPVFV